MTWRVGLTNKIRPLLLTAFHRPHKVFQRCVRTDRPETGSSGITLVPWRSLLVAQRLEVNLRIKRPTQDRMTAPYNSPHRMQVCICLFLQQTFNTIFTLSQTVFRRRQMLYIRLRSKDEDCHWLETTKGNWLNQSR